MKQRTIAALLIPAIVLLLFPATPVQAEEAATGTIKGTLIDANGQPMVGYKVTVVHSGGAVHQSPPTGADGKFDISGLPPGTYTYQIYDPTGKVIPVRIPPVDLKAGTAVSQPIAIVPKGGRKKGPLIAWLAGGAAAAAIAISASNGDDDDDDDDDQMTSSNPE